jgi:hypothetical protein
MGALACGKKLDELDDAARFAASPPLELCCTIIAIRSE